jgi:hypothetical protein
MNSSIACILSCAIACLVVPAAHAERLRSDHPMIGSWQITLPDGSCREIYRIRSDGTSIVTSGEEISESEFVISDKPSSKGFYKWVDTIRKDNGKKDCLGEITQVGQEATNYILLHPSGDGFLICPEEDVDTCVGPFLRLKGTDI